MPSYEEYKKYKTMQNQFTIKHKLEVMVQALPSRTATAHGLLATFGILLTLYLYFVLAITFNIVERKALAADIKEQTSQVSLLQASYTNQVRAVDENLATTMGFTQPVKTEFAIRKADTAVAFAR